MTFQQLTIPEAPLPPILVVALVRSLLVDVPGCQERGCSTHAMWSEYGRTDGHGRHYSCDEHARIHESIMGRTARPWEMPNAALVRVALKWLDEMKALGLAT